MERETTGLNQARGVGQPGSGRDGRDDQVLALRRRNEAGPAQESGAASSLGDESIPYPRSSRYAHGHVPGRTDALEEHRLGGFDTKHLPLPGLQSLDQLFKDRCSCIRDEVDIKAALVRVHSNQVLPEPGRFQGSHDGVQGCRRGRPFDQFQRDPAAALRLRATRHQCRRHGEGQRRRPAGAAGQ